jgi:ACS family hexuronate transporter-like MFS transporter
MAIFNSGTSIGSVIAAPLLIALERLFGWKVTFLLVGALGFGWLALWQLFYEPPERNPRLTGREYALILRDRDLARGRPIGFRRLLRCRPAWAIAVSRFFADPVWWLYVTWLPLYLYRVHGFTLIQIGMFGWLPFAAADAGSLVGGWASGFLIGRGWSVNRARKTVISLAMLLMTVGAFAAFARSAPAALGFIAVVLFGFQAWINNVQTLPSDYFPQEAVGSVTGMGGLGAGLGAILLTYATGWVTDWLHSYTPILIVAAALPALGTTALFALGGTVRRVEIEPAQPGGG